VNDTDEENKLRNREIAQNESARQTVSAVRVSGWAGRGRGRHRSCRGRLGIAPQ